MQNNEHPIRGFLRRRGYQLVLVLCAAAVGVSGFVFLRELRRSGAEELLPQETSVSVPVKPDPAPDRVQMKPGAAAAEAAEKSAARPAEEAQPELPAAAETAAAETAALRELVVRPVSGTEERGYSMDHLSFSPTMKDWRTHDGIDLACSQGSPVRAALAGTVQAVYDDDFLGTVVELAHTQGRVTRYANLTAMPAVSVGERVAAGQVIGAVGATALGESAEAAHLHFAYYLDGQSADPWTLIG